MTPRLFGLALLVHLIAWCGCIAQQIGGNGGPAPEPHQAPDVQDVVFLGPTRPLLIRMHIEIDGKPFRTAYREAWDAHIKTLFANLDRDADGRLSAKEAERMPPPQMFFASGLPGLGGSAVNVAFNFDVVDADGNGGVNLSELGDYYHDYSSAPFLTQTAPRLAPAQVNASLFSRLDRNRDGTLSKEEMAKAAAALKALDLDDDDLITAQELNPNPNPAQPQPAPARPPAGPPPGDFVTLTPGEGKVLAQALLGKYGQATAGSGSRTIKPDALGIDRAEFAQLDTDKDGQLNGEELSHFAELPPHLELKAGFSRGKGINGTWDIQGPNSLMAKKAPGGAFLVGIDQTRLEFLQNDRPPERLPSGPSAYLDHLQDMDANNDGRLSKTEGQPSPFFGKLFNVLDRNEDGFVTPKETSDYLSLLQEGQFLAMASRPHLLLSQPGTGLFDLMDRNQDGRLSPREARELPALLASLDADGDGALTANEMPRVYRVALGLCQASFNRFGGNLVQLPPQLPNAATLDLLRGGPLWFRKMDRNRDGDVSVREFLGTKSVFEKIDADRDGLISAEEAGQVIIR